jgi:MFS family permease
MARAHSQWPRAESSTSRRRHRRGSDRARIARIARSVHALVPEHGSRRRYGLGFWAVALTFLALGAFTTVPSPLYALYQARDGLSEFEVTVIYAAYAIGVIGALALAGHLSDWYGRRRLLIPAAGFTIASAIVFLTWKGLQGLLLARVLSGISFGVASSTATAYLAELDARHRPEASGARAELTATTVNMGGLGVGALVAGLLAQWVGDALTVPFVAFLVAASLAVVALAVRPRLERPSGPDPVIARSVCRYRPRPAASSMRQRSAR